MHAAAACGQPTDAVGSPPSKGARTHGRQLYIRWANFVLQQRQRAVDNLEGDFADGVNLCHLLEILADKPIAGFPVKMNPAANISLALDFLANAIGFKSYGINVTDIEVRRRPAVHHARPPPGGARVGAAPTLTCSAALVVVAAAGAAPCRRATSASSWASSSSSSTASISSRRSAGAKVRRICQTQQRVPRRQDR